MNTSTPSHFCRQCPRECNADREGGTLGFCGAPAGLSVARISLHAWEEPCISGTRGSGTVFFCGCNLRCAFCQNREISRSGAGKILSKDQLIEEMLRLCDKGAHNINLVTPTPYAEALSEVLAAAKPRLGIPVVYNCGGYESVDTLKKLDGLVDIYLPDVKYFSAERALRYSGAKDYFPVAMAALAEMLRQTGTYRIGNDGLLTHGVLVRHLVLPGGRKDSIALLGELSRRFGSNAFLLSLMSQYTPDFALDSPCTELHRRITTFEYDTVLREAERLEFEGYFQSRDSATDAYTPNFSEPTV